MRRVLAICIVAFGVWLFAYATVTIADAVVTDPREELRERFDCLMEAENEAEEEACVPGDQVPEQYGVDDAGDADGDGIDMCVLAARNEQERTECERRGSLPLP